MRVSDQSASSMVIENFGSPMHVLGLSVLAGEADVERVKAHVLSRLDRAPKYRKRLRFVPFNIAQPVLADDPSFHIDNHVHAHELTGEKTLDAALELALRVTRDPLNRARPLWAMHVITGFGQTLLVHVSHLLLHEGMSLGDDGHVFFDLQREVALPEGESWRAQSEPTGAQLVADAIKENTESFGDRTQRMRQIQDEESGELLRRATESVTRFLTEPICAAPWNQGFVGAERKFAYVSVPYVQIRQVRRVLGGTDNDVVLAVLAEACAKYMQNAGVQVEGQHLRVMCPVKVRREDEHGVRGTRVSGMFPFLDAEPLGIEKRLEQVRWETESIKQNREAQSLQLLSELSPPLPPVPDASGFMSGSRLAAQAPLNMMTFNPVRFFQQFMPSQVTLPGFDLLNNMAGFNFSCATAAGAQTSVFFAGHEVKSQMTIPALAANLGLGVAVSTYAQQLTFNLVSDANLMPDLETLRDLVEEQVNELRSITESVAA